MKPTLEPGIERSASYSVTADMSAPHLPIVVLSTPTMVSLIEGTCLAAAAEHLDEGETTVGVHICVSHSGPAYEGEDVTVKGRLQEIQKRRLVFEVEVHSPRGVISEGTHQRAVIDATRFG